MLQREQPTMQWRVPLESMIWMTDDYRVAERSDLHGLDCVVGIFNAVDGDVLGNMGQEQLVDDLKPVQVLRHSYRHQSHDGLCNVSVCFLRNHMPVSSSIKLQYSHQSRFPPSPGHHSFPQSSYINPTF